VASGDLLVQFHVEPLTIERDLAREQRRGYAGTARARRTRLRRAEALVDRGASTASTLDEARAQVDQLRATLAALEEQVKAAELRIGDAAVVAPFDGMVSGRDVDPGQYVGLGASLVTVVDVGTLELEAHAPLSSSLPRPRDPVSVRVDGLGSRGFAGEVERVNPVAVEGSRTVPVYIRVDNVDSTLVAGMFAIGSVTLERILDAIVVPADAVREDAAGRFVLRIARGRLERADVVAEDGWPGGVVRVVEGLETGDVVVTAPLPCCRQATP
jgi:RND family efflux transporter MFP subunit